MTDTNFDILIGRINGLIETLDNYIKGMTHQSINWVDLFTLVFAFFAVVISGYSIYQTYKSDIKNRESNENIARQMQVEENKRAEASIDANLTANARINWIQNVRQATAELITACYKYIGSKSSELQKDWEVVLEKKALFVLYFGPDDNGLHEMDLFNKKTNEGKNDHLVTFVDKLCSNLEQYHINHSNIVVYQGKINNCSACNIYNEETGECTIKYSCEKDEYGTLFDNNDCIERKNLLKKSLVEYKVFEQDVLSSLQTLSEIMRIYVKNEWKRAKKGK